MAISEKYEELADLLSSASNLADSLSNIHEGIESDKIKAISEEQAMNAFENICWHGGEERTPAIEELLNKADKHGKLRDMSGVIMIFLESLSRRGAIEVTLDDFSVDKDSSIATLQRGFDNTESLGFSTEEKLFISIKPKQD